MHHFVKYHRENNFTDIAVSYRNLKLIVYVLVKGTVTSYYTPLTF